MAHNRLKKTMTSNNQYKKQEIWLPPDWFFLRPYKALKDDDKMSLKFLIITSLFFSLFIAIMIIKLIMFPVHY